MKRFTLRCLTWKLGVTCEKLQLAGLIQRASSVSRRTSSLRPNFFFFFLPPVAFHLFSSPTCSGNTADFYLYAQMLWRYGLVGQSSHLSLFPRPASLTPSLPRPFHPLRGSSPLASFSLFLHVAINSRTGLVSTLNVICALTAEAIKCFQGPGSHSNMADCVWRGRSWK